MKHVPWWVFVSATPMGLGAWTPLVPARQLGKRSWALWGVLWTVLTLIGWVGAVVDEDEDRALAGMFIILGWAGAVATCLSIRAAYVQQVGSGFTRAREEAARRLEERREALRVASEDPALAEELGIGRPDRPGAQHAGVVDVNNAPVSVLATLPGVDDALATRIAEVRAEINGFASAADLGGVLHLDGHAVERLRDRTVFLPRR